MLQDVTKYWTVDLPQANHSTGDKVDTFLNDHVDKDNILVSVVSFNKIFSGSNPMNPYNNHKEPYFRYIFKAI